MRNDSVIIAVEDSEVVSYCVELLDVRLRLNSADFCWVFRVDQG